MLEARTCNRAQSGRKSVNPFNPHFTDSVQMRLESPMVRPEDLNTEVRPPSGRGLVSG